MAKEKKSIEVYYNGGTRVYSEELHGEDFETLAKQFIAKEKKTRGVVKEGSKSETPVADEKENDKDESEETSEKEGEETPEGEESDVSDADDDDDDEVELNDLSVAELKEIAKEKKVKIKGLRSKKDLIKAIVKAE